jgi:subtilisin family serine protease
MVYLLSDYTLNQSHVARASVLQYINHDKPIVSIFDWSNTSTTLYTMRFICLLALVVVATVADDVIEGEYIVSLNRNLIHNAAQEESFVSLLKQYGAETKRFFHFNALTMMHLAADESTIAHVQTLAEIDFVEPNTIFYAQQECASSSCPGVWGLDRTDQADSLGHTDPSDANAVYEHGQNQGSTVTAYIVDTGIRITHNEFETRAVWGHSAGDLPDVDNNGHGTHCAGTVGGKSYGVAQSVGLVAVKVLNALGAGSTVDIVDGLEWCVADHGPAARAVINLSLGGGANLAMDNAVQACIDDGITSVVAAGNSDADACNTSPARLPDAITVAASDVGDVSSSFTNYGSCCDLYAPGESILSAWNDSDDDTSRISGTSMACPHVVGAVARYQDSQGTAPSPAAVAEHILRQASLNKITPFRAAHGTTPNLMLCSLCAQP